MPYDVRLLTNHLKPKSGLYFFDSNILLYVMGITNNKPYEPIYINYFNDVYGLTTSDKNCRIITTSLQISEIFNRLLKIESNKAYIKSNYGKGEYAYYKDVYRKSGEIKKAFSQFKSDFLAYRDAFDILNCPVNMMDDILDFSPQSTDINDHLYLKLAKHYSATVITHDADMFTEDITILTLNGDLVKAGRNFVVPAKGTM